MSLIFNIFLLFQIVVNGQNCGERKVNIASRIINGDPSEPGNWPWHVAIYHRGKRIQDISYKCGGTIISKVAVLTGSLFNS